MSTIKTNNIANVSGSLSMALSDVYYGNAKAWVIFDGTTNSVGNCDILGGHNVNSVSDLGTGEYQLNFASGAIPYPDYCVTGMAQRSATNDDVNLAIKVGTTPTTTALRIAARTSSSGAAQDPLRVCIAVFAG
jgi:hypothetical protein